MARYPRKYSKDKGHLTTIRISNDMREQAEAAAERLGICFSDFVRQSINRNIRISMAIEEELVKKTSDLVTGKTNF